MHRTSSFTLAALLVLASSCWAQMTLSTGFAGGSGCYANFFDVEATGGIDVTITAMDSNLDPSTGLVQVWTHVGPYAGTETSPDGWTLVGIDLVTSLGNGVPTPLPFPIDVTIPSGQIQAFYVFCEFGNNYSVGTSVGAVLVSDAFLTVYQGVGDCRFFGPGGSARTWNGNIHYVPACVGSCAHPMTLTPTPLGNPGTRITDDVTLVDLTRCATDGATSGCGAGGDDFQLTFVAPFNGTATIDTCGAGTTFDTILSVLDGACGGVELACNDNTCGTSSEVSLPVMAGATYLVVVDGNAGATGTAEVRLQLTEDASAGYASCTASDSRLLYGTPRAMAGQRLTLPAVGGGGGTVAYNPCLQRYYAFDVGSPAGLYEVFDARGVAVPGAATSLGLEGRALWHNPASGNLELVTFNAISGVGGGGLFSVGLDATGSYDGTTVLELAGVPGLSGAECVPALDRDRGLIYSREFTNVVRVAERDTGAPLGTLNLDFVAAGSPATIQNSVGYTGVAGHELVVGTADSALLFDLTGAHVATVPLGVTVTPGDYAGNYAGDLYWTWDGTSGAWLGFDLFTPITGGACSSGAGGNLMIGPGQHTIDTDTGIIDGVISTAFDGTHFHFDSVQIDADAVVVVRGVQPFSLLATGDVTIDGRLDLEGGYGRVATNCNAPGGVPGTGGPGGFAGGEGGGDGGVAPGVDGAPGGGPSGGGPGTGDDAGGGGAGGIRRGLAGADDGSGQRGLGGPMILVDTGMLLGGSGGGGGSADDDNPVGVGLEDDGGAGGGGGGGALLVNAQGLVIVRGEISARGGNGAPGLCSSGSGGGGAGGTLVLLGAEKPTVTGKLDLQGGVGATRGSDSGAGSPGLVQLGTSACVPQCTLLGPSSDPAGTVPVQLSATSALALTVDVIFSFSTDVGRSWTMCTAAGASPLPNPANGQPVGASLDFTWDAVTDSAPPGTPLLVRAWVSDPVSGAGSGCTAPSFSLSCICGDCNDNGVVPEILDSLVAAQISAGLMAPTATQSICCDVDGSGMLTILDSLQMAQDSAGLPVMLACP